MSTGAPVGSGGSYLTPAAPTRLLVVLAQLPLSESIEVGRQNTPTATQRVTRTLLRLTPQVRVHLAAHQNAQVVEMPASTSDLRSHPMLTTPGLGRHRSHFFFWVP